MPFSDIIGHRRLVALLARSIRLQSLPPSLIFSGPSGVGKRLVALATAQVINCVSPIAPKPSRASSERAEKHAAATTLDLDACGACLSCRRIARGIHPDVLMVEPGDSGSIKIEQVREIIDRVAYRPFEGRRRVVIIDEADALVTPAQNALLKTLEEPPVSSVLLLVTSRPDVLLATVRSRCPILRFRPLTAEDVAAELVRRGHSEPAARAAAAAAGGSLGRALELSAGDLTEARQIAEQVLAHAGGRDVRRRTEGAQGLLAGSKGGAAVEREQLASHLEAMASLLRDAELIAARGDPSELGNPDMRPSIERLAAVYRGDRGVRAFDAVGRAREALDRNASAKIVADWLVLQL